MIEVDELVALFLSMDKEAREFTLATARSQARLWPANRPPLRLIVGQPTKAPLGGILSGGNDIDAPTIG
jgi:hypothetical protein